MAWTYSTTGTVHTGLLPPTAIPLAVIRSPEPASSEIAVCPSRAYHVEYGPGGQVLAVSESGGRTVLSREFDEQGRFRTIKVLPTVQTNEYGKDGVPTEFSLSRQTRSMGRRGRWSRLLTQAAAQRVFRT